MSEVAKINYLERQKSGMYYYRRRIPEDCIESFEDKHSNGFIKRSLRTKDYKEAKQSASNLNLEMEQKFQRAKQKISKLSNSPERSLSDIDNQEIRRIALLWHQRKKADLHKRFKAYSELPKSLSRGEIELIKSNYIEEAIFWGQEYSTQETENQNSNYHHRESYLNEAAKELLEKESIQVDVKHSGYQDLKDYLLRGFQTFSIEAKELAQYWKYYDPLFQNNPDVKDSNSPLGTSEKAAHMTLQELVDAFMSDKRAWKAGNQKTKNEYQRHCNFLLEYFSPQTLAIKIERESVKRFIDDLEEYPQRANNKKVYRNKSIKERIRLRAKTGGSKMKPKTINNKMDFYSSLFKYFSNEYRSGFNPFEGIKCDTESDDPRVPFSIGQLNDMFSQEHYLQELERASTPLDFFWAPLLALFSGMRRSEVCQLHTDDIVIDGSIPFIKVDGKTGGIEEGAEDKRHVKSNNARREIPIHQTLIELGFLDYVAAQREKRELRLFSNIKYGTFENRYRHFGDWFSRYIKRIGVKEEGDNVVFHSFRHNFKDGLLNNGVDKEMRRALGGWADEPLGSSDSTESQYGTGFSLENKNEAIQKLQYPDLNLSHLKR